MVTSQRCIRIDGVPIVYEEAGSGEPLVLIHGLSGSTRWWAKNIEALGRCFHVYSIDLVGFGESRGTHPFVLSEAAGRLAAWMDQLGIERANIVGHSMGGFIAAELAADFPDRIARLVLVDAAVLPFGYGYLRHLTGLLRALGYTPLSFLPVLATDAWRAGPMAVLKAARELLTADIRPKLSLIDAPTLLVWGEYDTVVPVEIGRQLLQHLRHADLMVIPAAGHNPMWGRAEIFNRAVLEFLKADSHCTGG